MRLYQRGKRGIWWVDTTIAGQRITRSSGSTSRAQAQEWASRLAVDTWRTSRLGEKPAVTFGQAVLHWLNTYSDSRRSIETIKTRLSWLCEHFEHTVLPIAPHALDALLADKDTSNASRNRYVAEISKITHHAHKQGWIDAVPAYHRYHEPKGEPRWLTREQADTLLCQLPEHLAEMAEFSLATGLRESNVRLLRWSQVDMARGVAWVLSRHAKNGRALSVPLNSDALAVLARQRGRDAVYVFVFEHEDGTRGPVGGCSTAAWYKAVKRAKLNGFRWHDLRHTWASWHVQAGTRLDELMQLGGWSSYEMVLRYAHLNPAHLSRTADAVLRDKSVTNFYDDADEVLQPVDNLGWLTGLEPATTGITIRDSTS